MNKEEYKKLLQQHYPGEPDEVLELAWHFHGVEKAKKYIELLAVCNHSADVARKAIYQMYVSCDVDAIKAVSEKFITALLPFTCMEKSVKPHSLVYHVRKMLDDDTVRAERKMEEARRRQIYLFQQPDEISRTANVTIQIQFVTDNEDFIRQILQLASTSNALFVKVEEKRFDAGIYQGKNRNLYRLECAAKDMPVAIINLRSIFGDDEPEVRYMSRYIDEEHLSMIQAQRLAENEPEDEY